MPQLQPKGRAIDIPLSQIRETGNVRVEYNPEGIAQLATSILKDKLLNPITVKKMDETDEYGNPLYELICGHRRKRAFEKLCADGNDFTRITAIVVTGDKARLQLIENVQRENLSPIELENGLKQMIDSGMTAQDIAQSLSKSLSWVCDSLKGGEIREKAESAGIDTNGISSKALSQIRSLPEAEIPKAVKEIKEKGGTVRAASEVLKEHRSEKPKSSVSFVEKPIDTTLENENEYEEFSRLFEEWTGIHLDFEECDEAMEKMRLHKGSIISWLNRR